MESEKDVNSRKHSSWPFVFASIAMAVITFPLFALYASIHWGVIPQTIRIELAVKEMRSIPAEKLTPITIDAKGEDRFTKMEKQIHVIRRTGESIMAISGIYPITGLASLIFAIMSWFRKPRWAALIALPFGIFGAFMMGVMT